MPVDTLDEITSKTSYTLPKAFRLLKRGDFRFMNYNASKVIGRFLIVRVKKNRLAHSRLGISASRKFGKAHVRNRFKRLIRESFRLSTFEGGLDIAVSPRSEALKASFKELSVELSYLVKKGQDKSQVFCPAS